MWNIEMTKHLKKPMECKVPDEELNTTWTGTINQINSFFQPERSKWQVHLFGAAKNEGFSYRPLKGKEPNWFWRKMQFLILGNKWVKDD